MEQEQDGTSGVDSEVQAETRDSSHNKQDDIVHDVLKVSESDTSTSESEQQPNCENTGTMEEEKSEHMNSLLQKEELCTNRIPDSSTMVDDSSHEIDSEENQGGMATQSHEGDDENKTEIQNENETPNETLIRNGSETETQNESVTRNGNETETQNENETRNGSETETQNENETPNETVTRNETENQEESETQNESRNENETSITPGHETISIETRNEPLQNNIEQCTSEDVINNNTSTVFKTSDNNNMTPSLHLAGISVKCDEAVNQNSGDSRETGEEIGEDVIVRVVPSGDNTTIDSTNKNGKRVHFADEVVKIQLPPSETPSSPVATQGNTSEASLSSPTSPSRDSLPCIPQLTAQQLIDGIVYQAQYLGSTPVVFGVNQKTVRMQQARDAVRLLKESQGDTQPRIDIDLKISVKDLILGDRKTGVDLITHPLKTVSYVADIENSLVIMAHRNPPASPGTSLKLNCHILETADPREVAMVIGQAFSTAYKEFLKAHGIKEESLEKFEYQHVLSSQSKSYLEINSLADDNQTKQISFAKHKGDILGLMIIDSGYGSAIPSCIIAHMSKGSAASKSGLVNVGDHILSINGTSLVGMPLKLATDQIKKCRNLSVVKMVTSTCTPVTDVTIMRPDLKYQLGFSVKDGNVCSLWRGSIAERSGVRVGHRIIEINGTSVVGLPHEEIVHMLSTTVGDIHIRTMPLTMYKILTGQIVPEYC